MIYGLIVMSIHDPNSPVQKRGGHLLTAHLQMPSPLDDDLPFPMCSSHCSQLLFALPILGASLLTPRYWRVRSECEAASHHLHCL